jgi:hypothetical protein
MNPKLEPRLQLRTWRLPLIVGLGGVRLTMSSGR